MLGAVIGLSAMAEGKVLVMNKPSRLDAIASLVHSITSKRKVPLSLIETLRGRLLYAAGHTFGRCTQLAIQLISKVPDCQHRSPSILWVRGKLLVGSFEVKSSSLKLQPRALNLCSRLFQYRQTALVKSDGANPMKNRAELTTSSIP